MFLGKLGSVSRVERDCGPAVSGMQPPGYHLVIVASYWRRSNCLDRHIPLLEAKFHNKPYHLALVLTSCQSLKATKVWIVVFSCCYCHRLCILVVRMIHSPGFRLLYHNLHIDIQIKASNFLSYSGVIWASLIAHLFTVNAESCHWDRIRLFQTSWPPFR